MLTDDQSASIDFMTNLNEEIIILDDSEDELIILTSDEENAEQLNLFDFCSNDETYLSETSQKYVSSFEWKWWSYFSETFLKSSSSFEKQKKLYAVISQSTRILLNEQNMNLINLTDQSNLIIINIVQKQNELMIA